MKVITVARKPLSESSVAQNVLEHGAGAIHVDASRVAPTGERLGGGGEKDASFQKSEGWSRPWMSDKEHVAKHAQKVTDNVEKATAMGRWPANLILQHHTECRCVGSKPGGTYQINRFKDGAKPFGNGAGHPYDSSTVETSEDVWDCHPECPMSDLDSQGGITVSSGGRAYQNTNDMYSGGWKHKDKGMKMDPGYGDKGGVARYFKQVKGDR